MNKKYISNIHCKVIFTLLIAGLLLLPQAAAAATTGNTSLFRQVGSGSSSAVGDYVSATVVNGGMNQIYQFYLEVPPNTTRIVVRLYDADIGRGGGGGNHDWQQGGAYNTYCRYTLYSPTNVASGTLLGSNAVGTNNNWITLATINTPAAGHWRLVSDMSSAAIPTPPPVITQGDDCNGWGFDVAGTNASGSVEIKAYAYSFVPVGELDQTGNPTTTTLYPYITSGCTTNWKDFDGDNPPGAGVCTITYRSRTGFISGSYTGSTSTLWLNQGISGYNTDLTSFDTGVWRWTGTYTRTAVGGGNFGVMYAGNYNNATTPPTSQPQADTFRIYLPSGTGNTPGSAPAKPIVTQKISIISGPNPPSFSSGQTTRVRVELAVFNPTAWDITFSSTNLVTSNIPGSGVVYAGNAIVSQGTVDSQPSISPAGTGNITWNPGTVSAGATATLYYQVDVTPASAGQRLPVTGNPGLNGTARYVDETGNTTQGQATYIYGPLCDLAVTEGGTTIPTWVAVSCFEACAEESQHTVEWHTATEVGTVGFNLWRQDKDSKEFQLVNPSFLPALPNAPQGGVYRLADPGAQFGEPVVYRLEEIDALGRTMSYGPFTVTFGAQSSQQEIENLQEKKGKEELTDIYGYRRFNHERSTYEIGRLKARQLVRQRGMALAASKSKERVRITVKGRGLFYVTSAQVANSLGVSVLMSESLINGHKLNMTSMGKNIAWLADANGAGIFFYNEGVETAFSDQNVYWLEQGSGLHMEPVGAGSFGAAAADQSYKESLHFEKNQYALTALFSSPTADIWLWDYVIAGGDAKSFSVDAPGVAASGKATLTVALQGETDTVADNDHHAIVSLNGNEIGSAYWDGAEAHTFDISFDSSLLLDGVNSISVSGALDMGAPYSIFYVESFDLAYQREYKAVNNTLLCRGDGNAVITVTGITESQAVVLDVSNACKPKQVTGAEVDVSGRVTFVARTAENKYLVNGLNASLRPLAVTGDRPAQLKRVGHSAEYLIIAPEELRETAQGLADYRKAKGLNTMVVTLEDIYENFNFGMPSPQAIREFLSYAYNRWSGKKVIYAVLAGKGTYDYKDYLGLGDNLVPVILAKTPYGLFAADKMFGDVAGKNGIPEIAIGRLPAVSNAELQSMINKIKAYENSQGPWTDTALMIADNTDDGGNFAAGSDELDGLLSGYQSEKLYLTNSAQAGEIRAKIIAGFNSGAGLVNYCGHAGLNQLAQENIFSVSNAQALQNGSQMPLMVMLTCVAGRFEIPGVTSLGEALLLNENGGIAGGLVPSGAAMHADSMRLGEEFYKAVFHGQETSAGLALLKAMKNYLQLGGQAYLLNIYNWLGDPALMFK